MVMRVLVRGLGLGCGSGALRGVDPCPDAVVDDELLAQHGQRFGPRAQLRFQRRRMQLQHVLARRHTLQTVALAP
jgi:hypothetical protein